MLLLMGLELQDKEYLQWSALNSQNIFFLLKYLQQKHVTPGALVSFLHAVFLEVSHSLQMESLATQHTFAADGINSG